MRSKITRSGLIFASVGLMMISMVSTVGAAEVETVMLPLEVYGKDVISVALPAINEEAGSPFDFILDPQQLIYETDAAKYGGGRVEEGATLLFRNHEGDYDFSRLSDRLSVRNQSNVPATVTITASVSDLDGVEVVGSPDFDDESCSVYLAIVDDEGNEQPVSENGEVSVSIEMRSAPEDAYYFRHDEETGEYLYEFSTDPENIDFDTYSFGLVGYCNPNGNWEDISVHPRVTVTWDVEPIMSEEEATLEDNQEIQEITEPEEASWTDNTDANQDSVMESEITEPSEERGAEESVESLRGEEPPAVEEATVTENTDAQETEDNTGAAGSEPETVDQGTGTGENSPGTEIEPVDQGLENSQDKQ